MLFIYQLFYAIINIVGTLGMLGAKGSNYFVIYVTLYLISIIALATQENKKEDNK